MLQFDDLRESLVIAEISENHTLDSKRPGASK